MTKPPAQYHVLVVDDDVAIRKLVSAVLRRCGFHVDSAQDGVEAVLKAGLIEYDVIVLDLMMPDLDGFSFLRRLSDEQSPLVERVIVTSAASSPIVRQRLAGIDVMYLPKPFEVAELTAAVTKSIERRESRNME